MNYIIAGKDENEQPAELAINDAGAYELLPDFELFFPYCQFTTSDLMRAREVLTEVSELFPGSKLKIHVWE